MDNTKGTFSSLNPNAKIFEEIKSKQPLWWNLLLKDKELYKDIRKDNYINVYYLGGSVAKIEYKNGFVVEIHHKYWEGENPKKKTYLSINPEEFNKTKIADIKRKIENTLRNSKNEHPSEKRIQGEMVIHNPDYIDTEFQFNQDVEIGKLRIDLVELKDGYLSFIELKGISDSRLRNDANRNSNIPEIIEQMETYKSFIFKYRNEVTDYYKKLIALKINLGLIRPISTNFILNTTPKLIIADTYKKVTRGRTERIDAIKSLLKENEINFEIVERK